MAQADAFNTAAQQIGGVFAADGTYVTFGGGNFPNNGAGLCITNMSMQYAKALSPFYEITSTLTYYISGRAQGSGSMGQVIGPGQVQMTFAETYGNPCDMASRNLGIKGKSSCGLGSAERNLVDLQMTGVTVNTMSLGMEAQSMAINNNYGYQFASLQRSEGGSIAPTSPTPRPGI